MLLSDYITQVQFLIHDQSNADFSQSELINAINNARMSVALDFHCVRDVYLVPQTNSPNLAIYRPVSTILNQESYSLVGPNGNNGVVVGANVTAGGANYSDAPTVTFPAPATGGIQAQGSAVVASGVITSINVTTWGNGYVPALPGSSGFPTVTITDPTGAGAVANAVMFNNVMNVISISYIWGNQRYMLRFRAFTLFQAYMRSQTYFTQRGLIWTIHEQSGLVLIQPPPDQPYQSEWDVLSLPLPLLNPGDTDTQVNQPWADAVQYYAAMLCLTKLQNFQQADYMRGLYSARVPRIIIGAGGTRIPNPYHRTYQRRVSR